MPLKLFFAFHEIQAEFTKEQLRTVIVFGWEWGKVPSLNFVFSKFNCGDIFNFCEFFMFP